MYASAIHSYSLTHTDTTHTNLYIHQDPKNMLKGPLFPLLEGEKGPFDTIFWDPDVSINLCMMCGDGLLRV